MLKYNLYTIGYSGFSLESFVIALKERNIQAVADVRTSPYSRYFADYNRDRLKPFLNYNKIYYVFLGDELGARPSNKELYSNDGKVDFTKVWKDEFFLSGIQRVLNGLEKFPLTLMCAEKDPSKCHRAILVARALNKMHKDIQIFHIQPNAQDESQQLLDNRLLQEEKLGGNQMLLTEGDLKFNFPSKEECIEVAYLRRGKEIAYNEANFAAYPAT